MFNPFNLAGRFNRCSRLTRSILPGLAVVLSANGQPAAISDSAWQQIRELQQEKASRSPLHRKLDPQFVFQLKRNRSQTIAASATQFRPDLKFAPDGRVLVDIDAEVSDALLDQIRSGGGTIISSVPRYHAIRALVPLALVETIAANAEVKYVQRAVPARTRAGSATSEGDTTHAAAAARATYGVTGAGVRVGVLSDSVDYLANSQASNELPTVTVLAGQSGVPGSGEGTAMLEIIHDLAPGASLAFATAFASEASFAQNILKLRTNGCDIIVDDVYYFDESPFQDGIVAQAVNTVTADGALYFSSAGNGGNKNDNTSGTWEGDFVDGGAVTSPISPTTGRVHSFGAANYNTVVGASGLPVVLFWNDPWGASTNDYDLYVLNSAGTAVLSSANGTSTTPWKYISSADAGNRIVIVKTSGTNRFLHLQLQTSGAGSLGVSTSGAIAGHCAASNAFAVAAVRASTSYPGIFTGGGANPVEYFSSDGLRRVFFQPDGTPFTPGNYTATGGIVRQKPDIAAADGVATSVPGFQPFYGTSAAAPHAAAIAALLRSFNPALTAAEVRTALTGTALDIEAAGVDRDSGAGIVMPLAALATQPAVVFDSTALIAESCVNNAIDPGETVTLNVTLKNLGPSPTTNLVATLLATNGVTAPDGAKNFGALSVGGTATHTFTFAASGVCGSNIIARLQLQDGPRNLGVISKTFTLGLSVTTNSFTNGTAIAIPASGTSGIGSPYPSTNTVSGITGTVTKVTVTLRGLSHTFPDDIDVILVGPTGTKTYLMSDCGGGGDISDITLTFNDTASSALPNTTTMESGAFRPSNFDTSSDAFPAPAPATPYLTNLAAFNGQNPNGNWLLYARDDSNSDTGSISQGWTLSITAANSVCCSNVPSSANLALGQTAAPAGTNVGGQVTFTLTVTNLGPDTATNVVVTNTLPAGLNFISAIPAAGFTNGNALTFALGSLTNGGKTNITLQAVAATAGSRTNTAIVSSAVADPTNANNSASAAVAVNAFPAISAIGNVTDDEDTVAGPIAFTISDAETTASALTLTASSSNTNLITTNHIVFGGSATNRTVTLTPATNQFGNSTITLTVSDGLAAASSSFLYVVNPVNDAPVLAPIGNYIIAEGQTLQFTNSATDVEAPPQILTFSLDAGAPTNAVVNPANGVFVWTPTDTQGPSTNLISVIVTDNGSPSLSATQSFTVIVLDTNPPPTLFTISGEVELQSFTGTNRLVRFTATETTGLATNLLQTTNVILTFSNGAAPYSLLMPTNTTHLTAKTAWQLRRRLPAAFSGGAATVNFTGAASLKSGDLVTVNGGTIDNTDNAVTSSDYLLMLGYYLQTVGGDPAIGRADVDGDGAITSSDYLILLGNYLLEGDSP